MWKLGNVCISRLATCWPPVIVRYCRIPYLTEFPKLWKAMTQSLRLHSTTKGCGLHGAIQAPVPIRARRNLMLHFSSKNQKTIVEAGRIDVVSCHSVASVTRAETKPLRKRAFRGTYPQEETRHWDVKWCESRNKTRPHIEMYWAFLEKQCKMCKKMVTTLIPICSWRSFRSLAQNRVVDGLWALGVMLTFNLQARRLGVASVLWHAIQTAGPGWTFPFQSKLRYTKDH